MKTLTSTCIVAASLAVIVSGCATNQTGCVTEDYEVFVDIIRDYAMEPESPDGIIHAATATIEENTNHWLWTRM